MTQDSTRRGPHHEDPLRALTRATLAASQRPGGPDCPDVEIIAAFYDGSIGAGERPAVEAHLSICARCQSEVAAIARADESERAAAAGDRAQGVRWWKWFTPIAAGAVAYGVWLAVQPPFMSSPPPELRPTSTVASAPPSEAVSDTGSATLAAKAASEPAATERAGASPAAPPQAGSQALQNLESEASAPVGQPMAFRPDLARSRIASADKISPASPPPPGARQDAREAAPDAAAGTAASPPPALRDQAAANTVGALKSAREESVASGADDARPDARASQWRIDRDGTLSASAADGKTWRRAAVGTRVRLTAVSAPGNGVAWAVGASGTVIRTIDGQRWNAVTIPTTVDLRAVDAIDASTATVTDVDGRQYRTTDGGVTWQPL